MQSLALYGITVRLQFRRTAVLAFYHQQSLGYFLQSLVADDKLFEKAQSAWLKTPESGITRYRRGDYYHFQLFVNKQNSQQLKILMDKLRRLPTGNYDSPQTENGFVSNNLQFIHFCDYFSGKVIKRFDELSLYDAKALQQECKKFKDKLLRLRFISPARLPLQTIQQGRRYIHNRYPCDIYENLKTALTSLISELKPGDPALDKHLRESTLEITQNRLFWSDNGATDKDAINSSFGGVLGDIQLTTAADNIPDKLLAILVLGQYTGIGDKHRYGLGSYKLIPDAEETIASTSKPAISYQQRCSPINNLEKACHSIARKHPYIWRYIDYSLEALETEMDEELNDADTMASINLHDLSRKLQNGSYQASVLRGVILRKPGKHPRPLAIPPVEDRIAQRAVVEVMGEAIDQLSMQKSFGYRKGHSRQQARDYILMLNRQGYKWFFEADINEYFDLISHNEIANRLYSLFPEEPLVPLIMQWIKAPVIFDGIPIERPSGLPQGSPVSPMLANLLLEDFDADLEAQGMKLVRFADDFVVLSKNRQHAQKAAKLAEQSLNELGLTLNQKKTHIGEFSDGFKFLGYTFLNGMAVETRQQKQTLKRLEQDDIPPASWLASLLNKRPQLLKHLNNTIDKNHRDNEPSHIVTRTSSQNNRQTLPNSDIGCALFVTQPVKSLRQKNGKLHIQDAKTKEFVSSYNWNDLFTVVLVGRHHISQHCQLSAMAHQVPIHFCSSTGKYQGVTTHGEPSREGADLWLQQNKVYQANSPITLTLAKALVQARIHNQTEVLKQRIRHDTNANKSIIKDIKKLAKQIPDASGHEQLRGYEGKASALYFSQIKQWIPEQFNFSTRKKRPSPDPFNALLSLGYTIIYSHVHSILKIAGLYPWKGFYHQGYGRHFALASDLMEVFRHLVERTAMTLLRSGQLKEDHFYTLPDGSCRLTSDAIRIYLKQLNSRILTPVYDKYLEASMTMQEHLLRTARQLVQNIRDPDNQVDFYRLR